MEDYEKLIQKELDTKEKIEGELTWM